MSVVVGWNRKRYGQKVVHETKEGVVIEGRGKANRIAGETSRHWKGRMGLR